MWRTIDIVPSSIRDDPQVIAACEAIDQELQEIAAEIPSILFWPFVDEQVPPLLDILAWELHVDVWEGWEGDLDIETKIQLINQSIDFHRHKGTRYAVDQILKTVFKQGTVSEWFEYSGRPYFFRILFEDDISGTQWNTVLDAVYAMKNVRSWLDAFLKVRKQVQQLWHSQVLIQAVTTKIRLAVYERPPFPAYDPIASLFFRIAGITDNTQRLAVDNLVKALKAAKIWNKMKAIYPFVGGNADSHSYNLKASAYQITWKGVMTHDANGIKGNAGDSETYGDTGLLVSSLGFNSIAFGVYTKGDQKTFGEEINAGATDNLNYGISTRYNDGVFYASGGFPDTYISVSTIYGSGCYILTRQSSSVYKVFRNGTQFGATRTEAPQVVGGSFHCPTILNDRVISFAFVSDGLSDAECVSLNTAVKNFETTLGRN
jgi:phage tail P2-like protein